MTGFVPRRLVALLAALLLLLVAVPYQSPVTAQEAITSRTVYVAMRDGTRLETTYWLPAGQPPFPVILVRTPYGDPLTAVSPNENEARYWAQRGYAYVRQFFRGTVGSEGVFNGIFDNQVDDGYDAIQWVAGQPWAGKVGLSGCSVPGVAAQSAVASGAPGLTTAWLADGGMNGFRDWAYQGLGAIQNTHPGYYTGLALGFTRPFDPKPGDDNYEIRLRVAEQRRLQQTRALALGHFPYEADSLNNIYAHQSWDEWWQARTWYRFRDNINIPTYHSSQWNDPVLENTTRTFAEFPGTKRLIVADNNHCAADYHLEQQRWFDYWLKGIDTGLAAEPPVKLQVMGDGRWRFENEWPLARTQWTKLFFRSGPSGTARSLNDGSASWLPPDSLEQPNSIVWDPNRPKISGFSRIAGTPGGDQRDEESQLLTFTSPPLEQDIEITGPITAVVYATSTAADALWSIVVTEVHPDGTSLDRTRGAGRANLRDDFSRITPVVPGVVYKVEIPIRPTSRIFKAGNRIRIDVANADFPRFGLVLLPSHNQLYHDLVHPSHLVLPVIPAGGQWMDTAPVPVPAR